MVVNKEFKTEEVWSTMKHLVNVWVAFFEFQDWTQAEKKKS